MTITLKIPQPDTEERLVLVPPGTVSPTYGERGTVLTIHTDDARDATPADLERGGYVPLAAFVGPLDLLSPPTLAGALEAIAHLRADLRDAVNERDDLRHHYDAAGPEHNLLALLDSYESDADTARAQASAAYAMVVAAIGSVGAETIEAAVARLVAERGALVARAEKAEAARDALRDQIAAAGCEAAHAGERTYECDVARPCGLCRLRTRAEKAERERDEALLRAHTGVVHYEILRQSGEEAARQRDEARAEVARLTAPGEGSEGEPTDNDLRDVWGPESTMANARRAIYRLGVAHERARHVEKNRATDEELFAIAEAVYEEAHGGDIPNGPHEIARRVAARVRQERCLVAQAVGMWAGVTASRTSERVPGTTGMWDVYVTRRPDVPGEHYAYGVPTADVPATLARLLGEVSR